MADKLTRIAIVKSDKCKPKRCRQECKKSCPVVRMGKLCIEVTPTDKIAYISENLCIGCGICVKVSCTIVAQWRKKWVVLFSKSFFFDVAILIIKFTGVFISRENLHIKAANHDPVKFAVYPSFNWSVTNFFILSSLPANRISEYQLVIACWPAANQRVSDPEITSRIYVTAILSQTEFMWQLYLVVISLPAWSFHNETQCCKTLFVMTEWEVSEDIAASAGSIIKRFRDP